MSSPTDRLPEWPQPPAEFQTDLAALDDLDDAALWHLARSQPSAGEVTRLEWLLEEQGDHALSASERLELEARLAGTDRFMRAKAHASALLQQRGHALPPLDEL
jgi:hypothetical protein